MIETIKSFGCRPVKSLVLLLLLLIILAAGFPPPLHAGGKEVITVEVEGTITSGKMAYLERKIQQAEKAGAELLVIILDTPGGLVDPTIGINSAILNAALPVAVLVAPAGAIAASAGSFILLSSDIAAMVPGTTVGAAHPVTISPEGMATADEKTTIFLAKHLRNLANEKGRPPDLAEQFVTENLTLSAREAYAEGVIEYLVSDLTALLKELDGKVISKNDQTYVLDTAGAQVESGDMNTSERVQNWLSDPLISFILLMLGVLGLYFGLSNPGVGVPEVLGGVALVMGIYGIGMFEASTTGIILLVLGLGLVVAEIFTPGFGVLGIGGGISLLAGALLLPREPLMGVNWYRSFIQAVGVTVVLVIAFALLVAQRVVHYRKNRYTSGTFFNAPRKGIVTEELSPAGMIKAQGEIWIAYSEDGTIIEKGTEVEVVRAEGTRIWVRPATLPEINEESREG